MDHAVESNTGICIWQDDAHTSLCDVGYVLHVQRHRRPVQRPYDSIFMNTAPQLSIQTFLNPFELYSDSRKHGYQGSSRTVRLGRVTPPGGGYIAKSEDGSRVVVTGKECALQYLDLLGRSTDFYSFSIEDTARVRALADPES